MSFRTLSIYTGTTRTFTIAATLEAAPYVFPAGVSVMLTAKRAITDPDSAAVFQKALGYGISVNGRNATVVVVPEDTAALTAEFTRLVWDLKAQEADGSPFVVAEGTLEVRRAVTDGIQSAVPIYTSQPPVPGAGATGEGAPLSNTAAAALGATASAGTSGAAARGDHVHPRPTPAEIGAAAASHTHPATAITEDSTHRFVTDAEKSAWNAGGGAGVDQTARDSAAAAQTTATSALARANHTGTQPVSSVTGLQSTLDGLTMGLVTATARSSHTGTQAISTVSGLQTALDGKQAANPVLDLIGSSAGDPTFDGNPWPVAAHTHAATAITQDATHRFVTDAEKTAWNAKASTSSLGALATAPLTVSTSAPSGTPATGAIWFQYTP